MHHHLSFNFEGVVSIVLLTHPSSLSKMVTLNSKHDCWPEIATPKIGVQSGFKDLTKQAFLLYIRPPPLTTSSARPCLRLHQRNV